MDGRIALLTIVAASVLAAEAAPKVIATGWDLSCLPPEQIVEQAERFAAAGFDGLRFKFSFAPLPLEDGGTSPDNGPANGGRWKREALERLIPVFRRASAIPSLAHSFVGFNFAPRRRLDWRADGDWADFAANMRLAARVARAGGLRGLVLDTEDYWKQGQFLHRAEDGDYEACARLARRRGAEVFRGVFEEYPDVAVITFWWFSFIREYGVARDLSAEKRGHGDLLPAFTDGLLDVMPYSATFVDGNEFTYHGMLKGNYVAQHHAYAELVSPENRAKYRACFRAGCGIYLDMFTNPETKSDGSRHPWYVGPVGGSRLNALIDRFEEAFAFSDDYVWVFGECRSYADWKDVKIPPRWEDAFTNGTWEASLPGFAQELRILKDPKRELLPRLQALEREGKATNVATEPDHDPGYSVVSKVSGVKHGEWYAFLVHVKSEHPWVWIHPTVNGRRDWSQRQDVVTLDPPDMNGVRSGIGFARVRSATTGFDVECSYNHNRRCKIKVLSLKAYRVYAP